MKINYSMLIKIVLIFVLFIFIYHNTLVWLYERYSLVDGDYSHGPLIPFISLFLIWQKRSKIKINSLDRSWLGLALLIGGLLLQIVSSVTEVYLISEVSMFFVIFGMSLYLFGISVVKEIWFALTFLGFMFPIPTFLTNYLTFPLRQILTRLAVAIMSALGVPVAHRGFEIIFPNSSLLIDTPCSGLRSLIAFLALGSLFAHFLHAHKFKKITLIIFSIPIAFLSNLLRILMLSIVTFIYGARFATKGFFHTFSGIMVFVFGFALLMALRRMLECRRS